jgi:hypothetical protein
MIAEQSSRHVWWKSRWAIIGAIALLTILVLTLIMAPVARQTVGSSYSRAPDGYGAWYAYMQQQGISIQRWQRPYSDISTKLEARPTTLLRVTSGILSFSNLDESQSDWVKRGNRLVLLGTPVPVTEAAFSTLQPSSVGAVRIDTRRRLDQANSTSNRGAILLGDRFGAIVWRKPLGDGEVIYASTPYLAANAYQDAPGNFKFLAQLVTQGNYSVWVDEYIHGYRETDVVVEESGKSWTSYLAKTPLLPMLVQGLVVGAIAIWFANRRFGTPVALTTPAVDNSAAYIEALAAILQKAESSEFVLDVVGKAEQLHIQQALGLGQTPLESDRLLELWVQQTGRPAAELESVLRPHWQKRHLNETKLKAWIANVQALRRRFPT